MNNSLIHILIIWSKASDKKGIIIEDLRRDFEILKVFQVHWDKGLFLQNYMTFYAHSQYHLAPDAFRALLLGKIEHCGDEDFSVVVLRDDNPKFETRLTSNGKRLVNAHMFDKKTSYRALTGGGHKIHSSDDAWETNHDLTLMFGLNTEDFCKEYVLDGAETTLSQNCLGIGGYKSIEEFFYVLNNCIRYVIMRNHECIPDQYTVEGHGDIDLLCDNKNWMAYLTSAKPVFPEPYRVYHTILIGGNEVPFDFRYIGDNYYDQPWQENILSTRILVKNLFYVPNAENQYYSLLYHAYIQKWEVKEDYPPKLKMYAKRLGDTFYPDCKTTIIQLDDFMSKHNYEYVRPHDKSVVYNPEHIALSEYALRQGQLLKRLYSQKSDTLSFHSRIYEKTDSFLKIGTDWLIDNEAQYLQKLSTCQSVPKVIRKDYSYESDEAYLEISRVPGVDFYVFFSNNKLHTWCNIRSFVIQSIQLLSILAEYRIAHRDFLPGNLIISKKGSLCKVSLIDFGWSTDLGKQTENRPKNLAGWFVSRDNTTDSNSLATILTYYWYDLHYIRIISHMLRNITDDDTTNPELLIAKYRKILFFATYLFSPYDQWRLFCRRHQRIGWMKERVAQTINKYKLWTVRTNMRL